MITPNDCFRMMRANQQDHTVVKRKCVRWTPERRDQLRAMARDIDAEGIAELLDMSVTAVRKEARLQGIKFNRRRAL